MRMEKPCIVKASGWIGPTITKLTILYKIRDDKENKALLYNKSWKTISNRATTGSKLNGDRLDSLHGHSEQRYLQGKRNSG